MSSQYTVNVTPESLNGEPSAQNQLQNVSDLPKILQLGLKYSPTRYPYTYLLLNFLGGGMGSFQMFTSITGSAVLGAVLGIGFASGGIGMVFTPDFLERNFS